MTTFPTSTPPTLATSLPGGRPALRLPALLVVTGALGVAATTALEVVTAPYSPAVRAYPINGGVHVVKVLAVVAFATGMLTLATRLNDRLGRLGATALVVLGLATVVGAVPYSLAEASLPGGLTPAAANERLDAIYDEQTWITGAATVALPLVLLAIVTLAVVVLRRRALPAWAPVAGLLSVPVAVLAGIAGSAGLPVPHPPTWLFLGLCAYGLALLRLPTRG